MIEPMCGRYTREYTWARVREFSRALELILPGDYPAPPYNIAPTQPGWVLVSSSPRQATAYEMRWGIIPPWAKDGKIAYSTFNARVETASRKPAFRAAWKSRRCLIPASGYYEWPNLGDGVGGPLHVIACHRKATESQAAKLLGFPDATIVSSPFGVFVADPVQKVQFAFITNCRDDANTRHGVQRFFEWLRQTNEEANVAHRAKARAHIVRAVAQVQGTSAAATGASRSKRKSGATTRQKKT